MHGYTHDKDAYLKRLRRIEGQVRGLQRMVDEDQYCIDILGIYYTHSHYTHTRTNNCSDCVVAAHPSS